MPERFVPGPIYSDREPLVIYPKTDLEIDNGADKIKVQRSLIADDLENIGLSQSSILKLLSAVNEFANEVKTEAQRGVHLGSNSLEAAIHSIYYSEGKNDPAAYGLQTDAELKAAAKVIESHCIRE